MQIVPGTTYSDADLAARFTRETQPLLDVLSRGARRLTRTDADAEDLLQDALLHAYTGFHGFTEGTNLKAWLFRILHNRWVSNHRTKLRRPSEVPVDDITEWEQAAARSSAAVGSAEDDLLNMLADNDIKCAMASLPVGFREAVYYADVEGYTYAETARLLNIPMGTVMSRVSRGRKRLRFALAHRAGGDGAVAAAQPDIA